MPVKPRPFTLICDKCGWKKTFRPVSDVLMPNVPEKCPQCGNSELDTQEHSAFSVAGIFGDKC